MESGNSVHGRRSGTPRLSTMTHGTAPSRQASASPWREAESAMCGLRIADADPQLDPRTDSEQIFLFRGWYVAIAMNSVKILHAVRSAITAIAELLVCCCHVSRLIKLCWVQSKIVLFKAFSGALEKDRCVMNVSSSSLYLSVTFLVVIGGFVGLKTSSRKLQISSNEISIIDYQGRVARWCSGRVSDSRSADHGFNSRPRHCRATTLGKLFTPMCLCLPSSISWYVARAFMSTCCTWQPWHGSSEQGEYCSKRFSSDWVA